MNPLLLTSMAAASTSLGGYAAVLLQRRVFALMAFGAGVLTGAALFDLLPSALSAAAASGSEKLPVFLIAGAGGLLLYCAGEAASHFSAHPTRSGGKGGKISAALLVVHSTLDGSAIFAASTVSLQLGLIVGLGVVAHDVCDGLNTILLATGGRRAGWSDYGFLALDALAPIAGGLIAAHLFTISARVVMIFLSLAAGSFLFTAVFGLIPETWRRGPRAQLPWLGIAGFALIFCLTRLLGSLS